jgi:hypothetical protein
MIKSTVGAIILTPLAFVFPFAFVPELVGIPTLVWMALFAYFNYRRIHPSHEGYLGREKNDICSELRRNGVARNPWCRATVLVEGGPMNAARFTSVLGLFLVTSCSPRVSVATVEVIDVSESITPRAERAALEAVGDQILHLGRGDQLIVIPITGDVQNDAGGRILRLSAPTKREPYDADLRRFREDARKRLAVWAAALGPQRRRTDILGALDVAAQEAALLSDNTRRRILVASDFVEDDGQFRFGSDPALENPERARAHAAKIEHVPRVVESGGGWVDVTTPPSGWGWQTG